MANTTILSIEKCIGYAHESISYAIQMASTLAQLGLYDDLQLIQLELERLQLDLLKPHAHHKSVLHDRAYLSLSPDDDDRPAS